MLKTFTWALAAMLLVVSCSRVGPVPDPFDRKEISQAVIDDFHARYPSGSVTVTHANHYTYDGTSRITFHEGDGLTCTAIYLGDTWMLTQKEYDNANFLHELPFEVAMAYFNLGITGEDYLGSNSAYVVRISRQGIGLDQYEFCFTAPYEDGEESYDHLQYHIVINGDGYIVRISHESINQSYWWYDMSSQVAFVKEHYPSAEIRGALNNCGNHEIYIVDGGIPKTVTFHDGYEFAWYRTSYRLADDTVLPDEVLEGYAEYRSANPGFNYTSVYYIETLEGNYFGLRMDMGLNNRTAYFKDPSKP